MYANICSSGLPPPHTEIRIVDPETGDICADGKAGELQFRGAGAFKGYYADPDATAAAIARSDSSVWP